MNETTLDINILVENNLGLVRACAGKFRGRGQEFDDLYQAGCIGLIKAARGFDPSRGFAFSTYAVPTILGEIKRLFRDSGSVKLGRTLKEKAMKAAKERAALSTSLGREPTVGELAQSLGVEPAEAAELINASLPVLSLTADEDGGGGQTDVPVEAPDAEISDRIALGEVLGAMPEKDAELMHLRYFQGLTQSKTAAALGMTQVQVSRREKKIITEMRSQLIG